jgi:hypothetical protein
MSVRRAVVVSAHESLRLRKPAPACLTASSTFTDPCRPCQAIQARRQEHVVRLEPREYPSKLYASVGFWRRF